MNKMSNALLFGMIALGSMGLAGTVHASAGKGDHEYCMHKDGGMKKHGMYGHGKGYGKGHGIKHGGRGFNIERMAEHLELTTEQRSKIEAIVEETRPRVKAIREQMRDNRKQLREVSAADTYDKDAVRKLADAQGDLKADMIMLRSEQKSRIRSVLTEEQRNKMQAMRDKHQRH
jgi:Spy/CpxP family protein refolding chaperone